MRSLPALVALAALAHAVGEMAVLWAAGADVGWLDALILLVFAAGLDLVVFCAAVIAAAVAFGRRRLALWTSSGPMLQRSFAIIVSVGYLAGTLFLLRHSLATPVGAVALLAVILISALALLRVWSERESPGVLAGALLAFAMANVGGVGWVTLAFETSPLAADTPHLRLASFGWMLLPAAAVTVLLLRPPQALRRLSLRRSIAVLASVLVIGAVATAILDSIEARAPVRWRTTETRPDSRDRPNVVLVVLDTVAAGHMDMFGHPGEPTMPALTRFARQHCDVVTSVMAPAPWTPATHASIFSGTWPHVHGCRRPTPEETGGRVTDPYYCMDMRADLPTLAEWLSARGYRCGAVVGNSILNYYGLPRGFGHFDARTPKYVSWTRRLLFHVPSARRLLMLTPRWLRPGLALFDPLSQEWRRADQVSRQALRWVRDNDSGPYFLFVNYLDAHTPYKPESAAAMLSRLPDEYLDLSNRIWESYHARREPIPEDLVRSLSSLYDQALRDLDGSVERFLEVLVTEPSFDDTLLIITSDHGEEFMEHGQLEHSTDVYEPQVRTPMLIRLPRALRGSPPVLGPYFQQVDLFATIGAVVGHGDLPETDGRPWGLGRDHAMSEVFENPGFSPRYRLGYCAVEMDGFKYIRRSDGGEELYDLAADRGETRNVLDAHPDLVESCRRLVRERDERLRRGGRPADSSARERLEQLRSLGYVQ